MSRDTLNMAKHASLAIPRTRPISCPLSIRAVYLLLCLGLLEAFPRLLVAQTAAKPGTLTTEDGLGFRRVTAVAQDRRGLLWFGTSQGLERYDGTTFLRFGNSKQADFPFPGSNVTDECLVVVNDSTFWLIADDRLYAFNPYTFAYRDISATTGLNGAYCTLRRGADGKIWAVLDDEQQQYLLCWDANGTFRQVATSEHRRKTFTSIAPDAAGNVWWSTISDGLRQYSPDGTLLHACKPDSFVWYDTKMYFTPLFADRRGRVFVFPKSVNQIWEYHPAERRYTVLADRLSELAYYGREDSKGNIWFALMTGLLCWETGNGTSWTDYSNAAVNALPYSKIHGLFEDQAHLLWVATDNGLLKLPVQQHIFRNYFRVPEATWGNALRGLFEDRAGNLYFYCETGAKGMHRLDARTGDIRPFSPFQNDSRSRFVFEGAQTFVVDTATNTAWALTDQVLRINLTTGTGEIAADVKNLVDRSLRNPFIRLRNGQFLLGGTLGKLCVFDPQTAKPHLLQTTFKVAEQDLKTSCFLENPDGSIWVGTTNGLFRIRRDGTVLSRMSTQTIPALGSDYLLALHADAAGRLWIGTFGGGLNCLEADGKTMRLFTRSEGLCDDNVVAILEDDAGNIWASTYNGLACYRPQTGVFQNFFEEDGLPNNEFNYTSALKSRSGRLWFGGMNGATSFDPKTILPPANNPPLSLVWFAKYNQRTGGIEKQQITGVGMPIEPIVIEPADDWFEFGWALPNYLKPAQHQYYVWLEDMEKGWSPLGSRPSVRYNRLPAGRYTLRIKGTDSKGNWSAGELAIPIVVRPFFYQTWWFYLLACLAAGAIVFFAARYRLLRRLEMERMRMRIASDLHDEVGSTLAGLAMQAELLEQTAGPKEAARLRQISIISRAAVSKLRDLVWGLDSRRDHIGSMLERMREQAAELLHPADKHCYFEVNDLPLDKKIPVDVRQHLFLIFKEAITNVLRHSQAQNVYVSLGHFNGRFEMVICDDGPAKVPVTEHAGFGLVSMQMRAQKLGAELEIVPGNGYEVRLRMRAL